ncbi:MAG: hypothetical protein IJX22_00635 [Opitutales bacterium]|nr:hypothetical protein [Opitutales bacterium]
MNPENFLLIDASSPISVCAGILGENARTWLRFSEEKSAALEGVFSATQKICEAGVPAGVSGFLFCEGPGSILGIRIAAASIRARLALDCSAPDSSARPVFAYQSLHLAAHLILRAFPQEKNFVVIAESRMNAWNMLRVENGVPAEKFSEIKTSETTMLAGEKIFILPHRRTLPSSLADAAPCAIFEMLKNDPAVFADVPALLHDCGNAPDAVNTSDVNSYARWMPERHRGN